MYLFNVDMLRVVAFEIGMLLLPDAVLGQNQMCVSRYTDAREARPDALQYASIQGENAPAALRLADQSGYPSAYAGRA